jgi:hypothetical protein
MADPSIAAHTPIGAVDVMGASAIILGCWAAWRYFERPTWLRLVGGCAAVAVALLIKHTSVILPGVVIGFAALWWIVRPILYTSARAGVWRRPVIGRYALHIVAAIVIVPLIMWALTLFDTSAVRIPERWKPLRPQLTAVLAPMEGMRLPLGCYINAFVEGAWHSDRGHSTYLLGKVGITGTWKYFPILTFYKMPLGFLLLGLLGIISLFLTRPRWREWSLLLPLAGWGAFLLGSNINIGFRHFLPAYLFILFLSARALRNPGRIWRGACWTCFVIGALHTLSWHPHYLSYIAGDYATWHPWSLGKPWLDITDSNIDWGGGIKDVRRWIKDHRQELRRREVWIRHYGRDAWPGIPYYLGDKVQLRPRGGPPPPGGILIISKYEVAWHKSYAKLKYLQPIDEIAGSMLVYDLDALGGDKPFDWGLRPAGRPAPTTRTGR